MNKVEERGWDRHNNQVYRGGGIRKHKIDNKYRLKVEVRMSEKETKDKTAAEGEAGKVHAEEDGGAGGGGKMNRKGHTTVDKGRGRARGGKAESRAVGPTTRAAGKRQENRCVRKLEDFWSKEGDKGLVGGDSSTLDTQKAKGEEEEVEAKEPGQLEEKSKEMEEREADRRLPISGGSKISRTPVSESQEGTGPDGKVTPTGETGAGAASDHIMTLTSTPTRTQTALTLPVTPTLSSPSASDMRPTPTPKSPASQSTASTPEKPTSEEDGEQLGDSLADDEEGNFPQKVAQEVAREVAKALGD